MSEWDDRVHTRRTDQTPCLRGSAVVGVGIARGFLPGGGAYPATSVVVLSQEALSMCAPTRNTENSS
jgi:hypothetical protein